MLPYFKRMETWHGGASPLRGTDGPLHVTRGKRRNPLVVALLVLLTMALIVAVALGGFALDLTNKFDNNVTRSSLLPDGDRATRAASAGNAQNILLLGSDSRTQELRSGARADVIQLVHVP